MEYSTILIIEIMFDEDNLERWKTEKRTEKKIKSIHTPANLVATWSSWPKEKRELSGGTTCKILVG